MSILEILLISLALAADAFSVGAAVGLRHPALRQTIRLSFHFGLFQSLMSLAGALAGTLFLRWAAGADHWIVFALLTLIGGRMIYLARKDEAQKLATVDLTRGLALIGLSLAVSVDALGVGVSLPAAGADIPTAVILIGVVAAFATVMAMRLAGRVQVWIGKRCEIVAGIVLVLIGTWTLADHLGLL